MSVWDDIADSPEEAGNLKVRAALIRAVRARVNEIGWSQTTAAQNLGLTQPRLSDLSPLVGNSDPVGFVKRLGDDVVPLLAQVG